MLPQFLRALCDDRVALASGLTALLLAAAALSAGGPARVAWPIAYLCLAYAGYRLWTKEHRAHGETEKRLTGEIAAARRRGEEALARVESQLTKSKEESAFSDRVSLSSASGRQN